MRSLPWTIQLSPKCNHTGPNKREAGKSKVGGGTVMKEQGLE